MVLSSTTQSIIQDFASTKLSSYQIAYKYSLPQKTAESILRKNLTDNFFENKEKLAVKLLKDSIQDLLSQNCSKQKIAEKVGISRSTCYRLIEKIENELDDDLVQIVSIEDRTVASDNNGSSEKELPELALSNTDMCNHQSSCSSATYPVAESSSEESDASSLNKAYQKYPPRKYYHRRDWGRDTRRQEQQWSTINLKGIRINFDLTICSSDLINKLITVIKENS
jgi:hypothetical protein